MADPNQPRQPRDMKGLLKFCFEATRGEDAPDISDPESVLNNMEPEKRAWLEQALKNMSVDVVEQLTSGIKILNSDAADDDEKEEVLDMLEDWLGNIDMAINFHKIGGYSCLKKCLQSSSSRIRAGASHLIAEISQNNPYCQDQFISDQFLELLLHQLDSDDDDQCQVKALYAISCISRDTASSLSTLTSLDAWSVLLRAVQRDNVKLVTKGCFFLTSAVNTSEEVLNTVEAMGMVIQLVGLLAQTDHVEQHHEHVLGALRALLTRSSAARDQARHQDLSLETLLTERMVSVRSDEEHREYVDHCETVLRLISPEFIPSDQWQEVREWQAVPPGCHVKVDLETGRKMARRDDQPQR